MRKPFLNLKWLPFGKDHPSLFVGIVMLKATAGKIVWQIDLSFVMVAGAANVYKPQCKSCLNRQSENRVRGAVSNKKLLPKS